MLKLTVWHGNDGRKALRPLRRRNFAPGCSNAMSAPARVIWMVAQAEAHISARPHKDYIDFELSALSIGTSSQYFSPTRSMAQRPADTVAKPSWAATGGAQSVRDPSTPTAHPGKRRAPPQTSRCMTHSDRSSSSDGGAMPYESCCCQSVPEMEESLAAGRRREKKNHSETHFSTS